MAKTRSLLADINARIAKSKRLKLVELGYRGERLEQMYEHLFGRKLPKNNRKRRQT